MTKLDDLREFIRNKNNKPVAEKTNSTKAEKQEKTFSLEVAGSDATAKPLASFGDSETDPDLIEQIYSSARNRVPKGEGSSFWDQD
jgi:hypothetical protein